MSIALTVALLLGAAPSPAQSVSVRVPVTSEVMVAVIDTGINGGILPRSPAATFACASTCVPEPAGTSAARHGTQVAGIIEDAAPLARIVSYRVTDAEGTVTPRAVRSAVETAVRRGSQVVNISVVLLQEDPALISAITRATGTLFVVAAGNDGQRISANYPVLPCMIESPNVLCVTSSGPEGDFVRGSNYSRRYVDLAAPGLAVPVYGPLGTVIGNGTSLAAPAVSGAAANLLARSHCTTPQRIVESITSTVTPNPTLVARTLTGGALNARKAIDFAHALCR